MKHHHTTRSKLQNSRVNDLQQIFKTLVNYNNIRSSNEKKIPFILSNFVYKKQAPTSEKEFNKKCEHVKIVDNWFTHSCQWMKTWLLSQLENLNSISFQSKSLIVGKVVSLFLLVTKWKKVCIIYLILPDLNTW